MDILENKPFKKIKKDPTSRNENRVNDRLKRLANKGAIDKDTYQQLRVSKEGSRLPKFYGSVKIHKQDLPLRPIVSTVGSAPYDVAKYVSKQLAPYVKQAESFIVDSKDFVSKLEKITIKDEEVMVSFDVKSLFTSVPVHDAINTTFEMLKRDEMFKSQVSPDTIVEMLHICLDTTSFQFRGDYYELTDGLAMGSPVSPAVANLFMTQLEKTALTTFARPPSTWYRFVDDVFSIIHRDVVAQFLDHLNKQHPQIKFTVEMESDCVLPFMDLEVHRTSEGRLKTGIYRKPTHTGRYLDFSSNHPTSVKRSVVTSLTKRLDLITLGDDEKHKEERRIQTELEANGYPRAFIKQTQRRRHKRADAQQIEAGQQKTTSHRQTIASIPYVPGLTEAITRVLRPLDIQVVSRAEQRGWRIMRGAKDTTPAECQPGVVYAIGCKDCPKIYIGETSRTARQRVKEHREHVRKGAGEKSAVAEHVLETTHAIHWQARVISKEQHMTRRKVIEALAIQRIGRKAGTLMNLDKGVELSNIWLNLDQ